MLATDSLRRRLQRIVNPCLSDSCLRPRQPQQSLCVQHLRLYARGIHVIHRNELERHPKVRMGHTGVRLRKASPLFYSWSEKKPKENFVLWNARGPEASSKVRG